MLDGVHRIEVSEALFRRNRSELWNVHRTGGLELHPQRIRPRNASEHSGEQVRSLCECAPHCDATRGLAEQEKLLSRRVALRNEILGAGDQVSPGVGLVRVLACQSPLLAQFAATAHVAYRVAAARFEKAHGASTECRDLRYPVETVGLKHDDLRTLRILAAHQRLRNGDPVLRPSVQIKHFVSGGVIRPADAELEIGECFSRGIVRHHRRWSDKALQVDRDARSARIRERFADEAFERQRDLFRCTGRVRDTQQLRVSALPRQHIQAVGGGVHGLDDAVCDCWHQHTSRRQGLTDPETENLERRRVLVREEKHRVSRHLGRSHIIRASGQYLPRGLGIAQTGNRRGPQREFILHAVEGRCDRGRTAGGNLQRRRLVSREGRSARHRGAEDVDGRRFQIPRSHRRVAILLGLVLTGRELLKTSHEQAS